MKRWSGWGKDLFTRTQCCLLKIGLGFHSIIERLPKLTFLRRVWSCVHGHREAQEAYRWKKGSAVDGLPKNPKFFLFSFGIDLQNCCVDSLKFYPKGRLPGGSLRTF